MSLHLTSTHARACLKTSNSQHPLRSPTQAHVQINSGVKSGRQCLVSTNLQLSSDLAYGLSHLAYGLSQRH